MKYILHYNAHFIFISGWLIEIAWESIFSTRPLEIEKHPSSYQGKFFFHLETYRTHSTMLPLKLLFTISPFQKCSTLFSLFSKEHQTTHSSTKGIIPLSLVTRVLLIFRQSTFFVNVLNAGRRPSLKYFHTLVFTSPGNGLRGRVAHYGSGFSNKFLLFLLRTQENLWIIIREIIQSFQK